MNFALLSTGQQAVTTAAVALPQTVPPNPLGTGTVRGEGIKVILGNLSSSTASLFYGSNSPTALTTANGKEIQKGTQDVITVNDTSEIYVIAALGSTATATWAAYNNG